MWRTRSLLRLGRHARVQNALLARPRLGRSCSGATASLLERGSIESLFVTSTDSSKKSSPLLVGLAHTLEQKYRSVGYFRPILPVVNGANVDHHVEVMRHELELPESVDQLYGVTSKQAMTSWIEGKEDDLVEEILSAYERCKADHDFMIVEGSQISEHDLAMSWKVNVDMAKALGAPVLLINDMMRASMHTKDLAEEILARSLLGKEQVEDAGLKYFGSIPNRVQTSNPEALRDELRLLFAKEEVPFLGFLPYDPTIASKRLNEVAHKLGAQQLFGNRQIANNVIVSEAVVATSHLRDIFAHLKKHNDGVLVITSADRSDILLGLLASRIPGVLPAVSGIILTNGDYPHSNTHEILQSVADLDKTGMSIPIFVVNDDTYVTANAFSRVSTDILPSSSRKIGQCKNVFDHNIETEKLIGELTHTVEVHRSPKHFKHFVLNKARAVQRHVVLTEGEDVRILQAADEVIRQRIARVTILGNPEEIKVHAKTLNLDLSDATILNPASAEGFLDKYVDRFFEKRKHKGITREMAHDIVIDPTYFGTMMVESGDADGMVSGACHTTANTIRPALQLIKTSLDRPLVSSVFFMCLEDGVRIYGDCAVNTDPSAEELAQIAVTSAESAEAFGMIPRVALLSYATGDSNSGPIIDKVREATAIAQKMRPDMDIYGPIQYDAAVDESIAKKKLKAVPSGARVGGHANVLIFPDLNTGNNTYKAVQQSTQCIAMGPMLQGLRKPVNDLSRGATVKDIITTVAITAIQADQMIKKRDAAVPSSHN